MSERIISVTDKSIIQKCILVKNTFDHVIVPYYMFLLWHFML